MTRKTTAAAATTDGGSSIPLRIVVSNPPAGVEFRIQRGRANLLPPSQRDAASLAFALSVRVGSALPDGRPNFLGDYAQGTPADRFVYVNSGSRAGQTGSRWDRRAKVQLGTITGAQVRRLLADPSLVLEARIDGTGWDGGPTCGTALPPRGWRVVGA